ncbi:MAG: HD domain-containing protein [Lachnospiraceae bacterium]|nr:HD domain-containing protein [Lachnospiraceae bacterium]
MNLSDLVQLLRTSKNFDEVNNRRDDIAGLLPEVVSMFDYDQNNSYHPYDLWEHCVRTALEIPKETSDDMVFLAALLHDIGKPESRCKGRKEGDTESHYYGHPEVSKRIVEKKIVPHLEVSKDDAARLVYYVEFHDDHVGVKPKHLRKHYERVPLTMFQNLMLLQMADAITHDTERPLIQERYNTCKMLYEGKAEELYRWLENEKQ